MLCCACAQMGHVAHLERRKQEADAERQTIEAYYEAHSMAA